MKPASALAASLPLPKPDRPIVGRPAPAIVDHEAPLIRRAQAGDRGAFGELCARHQDRVRGFLNSRLRGREADVDDLVAETFLTAMQRIGAFELERPGELVNWLIGIARFKLLDWHASRRRDAALAEMCVAAAAVVAPVSPEDIALDRLEVADLLARLAPRARRALVLQHVAGMPIAEIALALGTDKRSIWTLTGHARSELRGEVRRCACGCGAAIRAERWGRDRYASVTCARRHVLCACGCGAALPYKRAHNRLYATTTCRNRAAWRRRQDAQRRLLAGPATADPAVERVLAMVREAGGAGIGRVELRQRTRLLAGRLDRALDLLGRRWAVSVELVPGDGRLVMRYRAAVEATEWRAAA